MSTVDAALPTAPPVAGPPPSVLIIRAPYYADIVDGLTVGANRILAAAHADIASQDVAGAYELPQAIRLILTGQRRYDGFIALGCVIRGETDHYDFICQATMSGLMSVALDHALALGTGLLTVATLAQAKARSGQDGHNKGAEAAAACLTQVNLARTHGP